LYTGGKDSTYGLQWAREQGHDVRCLLTIRPHSDDSYMFHVPNIWITEYTSKCVGLPLLTRESPGVKEEELADLKAILEDAKRKYGIEGVVSGAVASKYQKDRVDRLCSELGLASLAPLWGLTPEEAVRREIAMGLDIRLIGVYAEGLDEKWLGRRLDENALNELVRKKTVSPVGEGGEFESLVVDAPFYKKRLEIVEAEKHFEKGRGTLVIKKVKLADK
jgi:ABC transporter with metal-binding/Fe-S-binding domain ATP-binding protein